MLEHIAAMEHHGDNRRPVFVLEAPVETNDDGWTARIEELRNERLIEFRDPIGGTTKCKRDVCGRIVEVFEPDGNHRRMKYDAEGNVLDAIDHARHVKLATQASTRW